MDADLLDRADLRFGKGADLFRFLCSRRTGWAAVEKVPANPPRVTVEDTRKARRSIRAQSARSAESAFSLSCVRSRSFHPCQKADLADSADLKCKSARHRNPRREYESRGFRGHRMQIRAPENSRQPQGLKPTPDTCRIGSPPATSQARAEFLRRARAVDRAVNKW